MEVRIVLHLHTLQVFFRSKNTTLSLHSTALMNITCFLLVKGSYLPSEWRDYFGVPAEKHEEEYKINLADGYITTDKV